MAATSRGEPIETITPESHAINDLGIDSLDFLDVAFAIDGRPFAFTQGSSIHTENSHKYGQRGGRVLLLAGGWTPLAEWNDPAGDFALILAEAQRNRFAP